jgi:hypothetical protein
MQDIFNPKVQSYWLIKIKQVGNFTKLVLFQLRLSNKVIEKKKRPGHTNKVYIHF